MKDLQDHNLDPKASHQAAADRRERHFKTDHLVGNLSKRSVRGGVVTAMGQVSKFALQIGSTAIIARILAPDDFGLIAMVAVFTGFVGMFKDLGLSMATVQRAEINHAQVSTLFWINVAASLILAGITAALGPLIAWFYSEPKLEMITVALAGTFIFGGLGAQHTAILRRQMRFKPLAIIELISMAAGTACGIAMAVMGAGYWALVGLTAAQAIASAVASFCYSGWLPSLPKWCDGVGSMVRFGGNLTGFTLFNYVTRNADNMLIGRFVGPNSLGEYSKAYALLQLPLRQINGPVGAVALPAMSRLGGDPERFCRYYLMAVQTISYASMPIVAMLCLLSHELVAIFLGPQWDEAARIFQVFAAFALIQPIGSTTGWVMIALDQTRRMFRWGVFQSVISLAVFAAGLPWGAYGVAVAATIGAFVMFIPTLLYAYHQSPITLGAVARSASRPFFISAILFAVGFAAQLALLDYNHWVRTIGVLAAAGIAGGAIALFWPQVRKDIQVIATTFKK